MTNIDDESRDQPSEVRIRRAPKIPTFIILGGGLGAIVTFIVTALYPVDPAVGFGALFGYFALYGVTAGVVLGAIVAIILDRRSSRRSQVASAVRVQREVEPERITDFDAAPDEADPSTADVPAPIPSSDPGTEHRA